MPLNIVLVEPEIPQNTGNISRTCAVTGAVLHLVKPLGFSTDDKHLKRAGLDYWHLLDIRYYESLMIFQAYPTGDFILLPPKENGIIRKFVIRKTAFVLRKETAGLPRS